jgi:D-alanyl-D-alanine carboxypeptidase
LCVAKFTGRNRSGWFVLLPPAVMAIAAGAILGQAAFAPPVSQPKQINFDFLYLDTQPIEAEPAPVELPDPLPNFPLDEADSLYVVVNKQRPLEPIDYTPEVITVESEFVDNSRGIELAPVAAEAVIEMAQAAQEAGVGTLKLNSGYRSYDYQAELFIAKIGQYGEAEALERSAKAGHSEHQTGLAVDVSEPSQGCEIMQCFGDTEAGIWIAENAWRFGYIVRYELDQTSITGYTYEPWHLRYVGKELAERYYEGGFNTLEEFWGLDAAPEYLAATAE